MLKLAIMLIIFFVMVYPPYEIRGAYVTTNIAFVGDSITEGSIGESYIEKLSNIATPWGSENVTLVNSGSNGYRMSYFYNNEGNIEEKIFDVSAHYVILFLGLNDVSSADPSAFDTHYRYLIDTIYNLDVNNQIEQIFLIKFSYSNGVNEMMALEYLEVIENVSIDYDLPILDLWNATYLQWDYFYDHAHLSDLGAEVVANEIDNAFGDLISPILYSISDNTSDVTFYSTISLIGIFVIVFAKSNSVKLLTTTQSLSDE